MFGMTALPVEAFVPCFAQRSWLIISRDWWLCNKIGLNMWMLFVLSVLICPLA